MSSVSKHLLTLVLEAMGSRGPPRMRPTSIKRRAGRRCRPARGTGSLVLVLDACVPNTADGAALGDSRYARRQGGGAQLPVDVLVERGRRQSLGLDPALAVDVSGRDQRLRLSRGRELAVVDLADRLVRCRDDGGGLPVALHQG